MSLSCLNIDFDLIKVYIHNFNTNIEGSIEDQEYLSVEITKFHYDKYHDLALYELFQAVRNYFIANSRLDLVEKLMLESGQYSYYGSLGTGCYLPDLFIATRYANLKTFGTVLKNFEDATDTSHYDDSNKRGEMPSFMKESWYLDLKSEKNYLIKNNDLTLRNWSKGNVNPGNKYAGNVVDCNILISLAKENKNNLEIRILLEKYQDCFLVAFYWNDYEQKYPNITYILGKDKGGYIMAIPKKSVVGDINENRKEYNKKLNSTENVMCGVNIYLLE